jgi:flagellar assembly protein FliH
MSSRIIRGDPSVKKIRVTGSASAGDTPDIIGSDHVMNVEKQAFEQGYKEGERIGKQMGERMVDTAVKRYERSIQDFAALHQGLAAAMERETVQLALGIARKVIQREVAVDTDLVTALVSVALKRVQGHTAIVARVSSHDFERVRNVLQASNASITVKEDSSFERGDFVLDSVQTHVDGRVSSQIDAIGRALLDE